MTIGLGLIKSWPTPPMEFKDFKAVRDYAGQLYAGLTENSATVAKGIASAVAALEPAITAGTSAQYYRGDKAWATLNKAAVGLTSVEDTALSTWAGTSNITTVGALTQQAWQEIVSFTNSWVNYGSGYATAAYFKDSMGVVHLKGNIKDGTVDSSAFTLPAGYRPSSIKAYAVESNSAFGRVHILTDGTVVPYTPSNNTYVSLDNISFRVA